MRTLLARAETPNPTATTPPFALVRTLTVLFLGVLGLATFGADSAKKRFEIPAGPASVALKEFAKQASVQLIYDEDKVAEVHTAGLYGDYEPREGLGILLAGTRLAAVEDEKTGALTIQRAPPDAGGAGAAASGGVKTSAAEQKDSKKGDILTLREVEVTAFQERDVDLPRGQDDIQPYRIFPSAMIDESGAVNLESFLKKDLPMNTQGFTGSSAFGNGATSYINLRGLGTGQTLILIDGRRTASVTSLGTALQPALNTIPIDAIERIEVLPSSASAIYGGSAMGGVINVILKHNFSGEYLRASYGNVFVGNAATESLDVAIGRTLEGGRTRFMIAGHYSHVAPLYVADRPFLSNNYETIAARSRALGSFTSVDYATTNITSQAGNLVLKNGTALNSPITSVSAGAGPGSDLTGGLVANAGQYNAMQLPGLVQGRYLQALEADHDKSLMFSLSRDMTPWLELFSDFATRSDVGGSIGILSVAGTVPAAAPTNPFQQAVTVTFPGGMWRYDNINVMQSLITGAKMKLPGDWMAEADYNWTVNNSVFETYTPDTPAVNAALANGTLNPFVDFGKYSVNAASGVPLSSYVKFYNANSPGASVNDTGFRASGPVFAAPAGWTKLTVGIEHRKEGFADSTYYLPAQLTPTATQINKYFGNTQTDNSAYAEIHVPLFGPENGRTLMRELEFQMAGRVDRYRVGTGTTSATIFPYPTPTVTFNPGNLPPYRNYTSYNATNSTVGFKYKPTSQLAFRVSYATAFLPPSLQQLSPNPPAPGSGFNTIQDPKTGTTYNVFRTITGGNPSITPQRAKDWNVGVIYEPQNGLLHNFRANFEYYHIEESNVITTLSPQQIVNLFPNRLTRDPSTGLITEIDATNLNLFRLETSGWDGSLSWLQPTSIGSFELSGLGTWITTYGQQTAVGGPLLNYVGYMTSGGPIRFKGNLSLFWNHGPWRLGWTTSYYSNYWEYGAPGDPQYGGNPNATPNTTYTSVIGRSTIPAQVYHDVFASYSFSEAQGYETSFVSGLTIQVSIGDLFNTAPPIEPASSYAPYARIGGDPYLRNYTVTIRKKF